MGSLLVVTGPPGAGKSAVARLLADRVGDRSALVEGDRFFGFLARGAIERVATRVGHGFTDEAATRAMHAEFASSGLDGRQVRRDHGDAEETVAWIEAARARGELTDDLR